jgi:hypothetical protein
VAGKLFGLSGPFLFDGIERHACCVMEGGILENFGFSGEERFEEFESYYELIRLDCDLR